MTSTPTDPPDALSTGLAIAASGDTEAPPRRTLRGLMPIILQTLLALAAVVALLAVGVTFFREPLQQWATWMVETLGIWGILLGIFASDALALPIPPDTFLFIAATSDMPALPVLTVISVVSLISGHIAYFLGPHIARLPLARRKIEAWRPRGEALFRHWGVWAVAIGALSPLPYAMTCWFAGIYKMRLRSFSLATLFRIPRLVGYYYLFVFGWVGGA